MTEEAAALGMRPAGLTVAAPGLVGRDRHTVLRAPNLGWEQVAVAELLAIPALPVAVENEANLGALAELWLGGHDDIADFIHVSAEIGIGAALVVDGRLFRGARGFAGELGHVPVRPDGPRCSCGAHGCLETYAGEEAVLRAAGIDPAQPDRVKALHTAAADGDEAALSALRAAGQALGIALSGAVNLLDPQAVVLGGPLAALAPWLRDAVERELTQRVTDRLWPAAGGVLVSRLGRDGVLLGAAYSAVRAVLDDPAGWAAR
jgi:predicted NBD/HSP70 family sugar kinase